MVATFMAYANSAGDRWVDWIVGATLESALLFALAGLVWLAIRKRVAPQVGYGLFLLVPLKLLVPLIVTVPLALAQWTPSALASSWIASTRAVEERSVEPAGTGLTAPSGPTAQTPEPMQPAAGVPRPDFASGPVARPVTTSAEAVIPPLAAETPHLSASAVILLAWLGAVALLLGRLARSQLRFRARMRHALPLDESRLHVDFPELCRRAGVPETIRIVELDSIPAPAVWGVLRPTIILPRGIAATLTPEQLRWALLHELVHIRQFDLVVLTLQRVAAILHGFNPVVWVANRIIHQLREYACDDLALALSRSSPIESGEAFVRILRHADHSGRRLDGALGIFGLDSRASCFQRVRRLLDTDRPIHAAPGVRAFWGLLLLAALSVPQLRAALDDPATQQDASSPAKAKASGDGPREFELRIVGPDGKAIPEAVAGLRADLPLTPDLVRRGTFVKTTRSGIDVKADAEGRLAVTLPRAPTRFSAYITIPGYGPYWARWSTEDHDEPVPPQFTAKLDAAWSVGGVIVDPAGKPIEGVAIRPAIEFKKRPGVDQQMGIGAVVKSDAAGRWRFDSVPGSLREVYVEINHPGFKGVGQKLTRSEFGIEPAAQPTSRIALQRGLTVAGTVTDEAGKPIAGALVRTKFLNDIREAKTGNDGTYRLQGCEPRTARVVVSAKGRATDMKEVRVDPEMEPVDFRMKPGGTVRIRVLDEHGKPVPKARIFFQSWRGRTDYFEFDHKNQYADKDGVWVWNEAPLDEFQADICSSGDGMDLTDQPLLARAEEYVFRLPGPLVISGKVVDAETKAPIKAFRVVPGVRGSPDHMNWIRGETFAVTDGRYELRRTRGDLAHLVRIEADGYKPGVSREIKSTEGHVTIDFALKRGDNIVARVMTPGVRPAAGARVALGVAGSQISVSNGDIDDGSTYAARAVADDTGRFQFPAQDRDFQLVITHPEGYAYIKSSPAWDRVRIIRLEPWARVEGTFRIGPAPVANVPITIDVEGVHSYGNDVPSVFAHHNTTTGPDGRFTFDRVFAGRGHIGRRIMLTVRDGSSEATSSTTITANLVGGKTNTIDLGGKGRPVVGQLQPPDGFDQKVLWNFALVNARPPGADQNGASLAATVGRDGKFRFDDVPAGEYVMHVWFSEHAAGQLLNHRFNVPPGDGKPAAALIDLGTMKLTR